MVLEDPMSRLMASQGMPVGLSLGPRGGQAAAGGAGRGAAGDASDDEVAAQPAGAAKPEPAYQMEAFSDMLRAAARGAGGGGGASSGRQGGGDDAGPGAFGVQSVGPSQDDAWGTTRASPAEIAARIAESNREAGTIPDLDTLVREAGAGAASESDDDDGVDLAASPQLSPSEQKYASLEAMSAEIKKLDEVFEVLASVPWLDEDNLAEKELKGVALMGLLGTLEEVGFQIRPQLARIWAGERGAELASAPGLEYRDQAALIAILYHTQQIEDKHGPPAGGYLKAP